MSDVGSSLAEAPTGRESAQPSAGARRHLRFEGRWETKRLEEVLRPIPSRRYQLPTSDYKPAGRFPIIDQGKEAIIAYADCVHRVFAPPDGGVIVFGDHTCIVKFRDEPFILGADGTKLLVPRADASARFLYYVIEATHLPNTGYNRHLGLLLQTRLVLPSSKEQRDIVAVLSDVDELIGSLESLITKKRAIRQAAMQELLTGRTRLPGFGGAGVMVGGRTAGDANASEGVSYLSEMPVRYQHTEVGVIPEDWGVSSLGSLLAEPPSYGINAPAVPFDGSRPTYIRITDIGTDGRFRPSPRVSVNGAEGGRFLLRSGDLVFARTGASVGKSYLYDPKDGPLVFAGFLIRVTPDTSRVQPAYVAYYAQTQPYWEWVANNSARSGQPGINSREYGSLRLPLPPLPEQNAIANVLSDMDAEIAALDQRLDKTRVVKQGMMQQLLTGAIRLPIPETAPEDESSR